jgi:hypothetical protein
MSVEAVIHGTKKWRTKAIAATTSTKPYGFRTAAGIPLWTSDVSQVSM